MIIFPIETVVRELPYKLDLASGLNGRLNETVVIAPKNICIYLIKILGKNTIYFDKGYHKGASEQIYRTIKAKGGIIVSLDEEGAVDYPDWRTLQMRYSKTLFNYADIVFFWGEKQKKFFENRLDSSGARIVTSGHPRFFLEKGTSYEKRHPAESYILINTNMSFGNNLLGEDFVIRNYSERILNLDELIEFDKSKIELILDFIREFRSRSDIPIILRPHPEERESAYKLQIKDYQVSKSGIANDMIVNSYNVVHTDCTTAVEAYLLGFRPVSLLPVGFENFKTVLPRKVSICFNDVEDAVENILDKDEAGVVHDNDLYQWLQNSEDPREKIIGEIIALRNKSPYQTSFIQKNISFLIILAIISLARLKEIFFRRDSKPGSIGRAKLEQLNNVFNKSTRNRKYKVIHKFVNTIVFK
jgi:surface carbohydrate biosynthesis protein